MARTIRTKIAFIATRRARGSDLRRGINAEKWGAPQTDARIEGCGGV